MTPNPPSKLTMAMAAIADRLEEAAHTLRRLPKVTVQGFKSNWPPTVLTNSSPAGSHHLILGAPLSGALRFTA
jgi:hypothetical protein